jgi:hypothetical protein
MKYIVALIMLASPVLANIDVKPAKILTPFPVKAKQQVIMIETPNGDIIAWPKSIIPRIRIYSVSTKTVRHATYKFIVQDKSGRYEIPVTEESYFNYKREMNIK